MVGVSEVTRKRQATCIVQEAIRRGCRLSVATRYIPKSERGEAVWSLRDSRDPEAVTAALMASRAPWMLIYGIGGYPGIVSGSIQFRFGGEEPPFLPSATACEIVNAAVR
jgi:hypothetical protein